MIQAPYRSRLEIFCLFQCNAHKQKPKQKESDKLTSLYMCGTTTAVYCPSSNPWLEEVTPIA